MSKYLSFPDIVFKDRRLLLAALVDLGYSQVEEGDALHLYGYQGDQRPETAQLVVRRSFVGSASNDLGFVQTPEGYTPLLSEYDQRTLHSGQFVAKLRVAYSEQVVEEVRRRLHGSVRRSVDGGVVKITVRY